MTHTQTKQKPKLSVRKPGYWRNKYSSKVRILVHARESPNVITGTKGPGEFLMDPKYPSAEIAEQNALENLAAHPASVASKGIRYLGPQFFPEGDDQ